MRCRARLATPRKPRPPELSPGPVRVSVASSSPHSASTCVPLNVAEDFSGAQVPGTSAQGTKPEQLERLLARRSAKPLPRAVISCAGQFSRCPRSVPHGSRRARCAARGEGAPLARAARAGAPAPLRVARPCVSRPDSGDGRVRARGSGRGRARGSGRGRARGSGRGRARGSGRGWAGAGAGWERLLAC